MESLIQHDLSDRLDPMTVKELRQSLRRSGFVLPFLGIHLFALVATVVEFRSGHATPSGGLAAPLNPWLLVVSGPFWMVAGAVCMVLMPLAGLLLMREELDEGNHELLLLTHLSRWRVVIGKFATLWGMSVVTFVSLLPYLVVRYLVGGIEWWNEAACAATVIAGAAMISAGAIGASAFRRIGAKVLVFSLFLGSMTVGCLIALVAVGVMTGGGVWFHLTALMAAACYTTIGLALARARLRLALMIYEANPGRTLLGLLVFAPFIIGMLTALTAGYGGIIALALITLAAMRMDLTSRFSGLAAHTAVPWESTAPPPIPVASKPASPDPAASERP